MRNLIESVPDHCIFLTSTKIEKKINLCTFMYPYFDDNDFYPYKCTSKNHLYHSPQMSNL